MLKLDIPIFNHHVNKLPECLIEFQLFSFNFIESFDNLPINLKVLNFDCKLFNKPIDNLPVNLEILSMHCNFNEPLNKLPQSLKYLTLNSPPFDHPLNNLPESLKVINIYSFSPIIIPANINLLVYDDRTHVELHKEFNFDVNWYDYEYNYDIKY